jgi:hypothetical protein
MADFGARGRTYHGLILVVPAVGDGHQVRVHGASPIVCDKVKIGSLMPTPASTVVFRPENFGSRSLECSAFSKSPSRHAATCSADRVCVTTVLIPLLPLLTIENLR